MSLALQTKVNELIERFDKLEKTQIEGLETKGQALIASLEERLKKMEEKYHMLNARLTKYKVD